MGTSESTCTTPFVSDPYMTLPDEGSSLVQTGQLLSQKAFRTQQVVSMGFQATWSMLGPNSVCPESRSGHFTAYNPISEIAYIGYGIDVKDTVHNDLWTLDLKTRIWTKLNLTGNTKISPRTGSAAVLVGHHIYIFGGFTNMSYHADFHAIDLKTLTIHRHPDTGGPAPRIGHVMAHHDSRIMIWGGYNGNWLSDLWIYDIDRGTWREVATEYKGRTATAFCSHGNSCYIFGCAKVDGLLRFDWETETLSAIQSIGTLPHSETPSAELVGFDQYLFLTGGKSNENYGFCYVFDTVRQLWFLLNVYPDDDTTSICDGTIDSSGYFKLPRTAQSSIVYRNSDRSVNAFLGTPFVEPPLVSYFAVGEALAVLHHQTDMLSLLDFLSV